MVSIPESCDTRLRESQVFRGGRRNGKSGTANAAATGISTREQKSRIHYKKRWTRHAGNPNEARPCDTGIRPWRSGMKCYRLIWAQTRERARTEQTSGSSGVESSRQCQEDIAGRRQRRLLHGEVTFSNQDRACRQSGSSSSGLEVGTRADRSSAC